MRLRHKQGMQERCDRQSTRWPDPNLKLFGAPPTTFRAYKNDLRGLCIVRG